MVQKMTKKDHAKRTTALFFTGFAMGTADIIPGVSGGTMAFILGIYEELIYSIKKVSGETLRLFLQRNIKEGTKSIPFSFLLPLGTGILIAVVLLAPLISHLLENEPVYLWSFFFGLVAASIVILRKRVVTWDLHDYAGFLITALLAYLIVGSVPVETPANIPTFFFAGAIAICAMILPGISGSFLLILMGKYSQILDLVVQRDFLRLGVVALGAVIGLAFFSRVLSWLFAKHHDIVVAALTGFMLGSLRKLWPWKEVLTTRINSHGVEVALTEANILPTFSSEVVWALGLALLGAYIIITLDKKHVTDSHTEDVEDIGFTKEHTKAVVSQTKGKV